MKTKIIFLLLTLLWSLPLVADITDFDYQTLTSFEFVITEPKTIVVAPRSIDQTLWQMAKAGQFKTLNTLDRIVSAANIVYRDNKVAITMWIDESKTINAWENIINNTGGEITAQQGHRLLARVPLSALEQLAMQAGLNYAEPQVMYSPMGLSGKVISEGVKATAVKRLHTKNFTGKGVKVGILDFGFAGYQALVAAGELPAPVATKAFNGQTRVDTDEAHGTACAEIIHDMAPDASLYFAAVTGATDEIWRATHWLMEQGVDIINFSGGGHNDAHNGNSLLDQMVNEVARRHGVLWINAAGNEGETHWLGKVLDNNQNQRIDIPGTEGTDVILLKSQGQDFRIIVNWDDWHDDSQRASARIDVDAYLFSLDPKTGTTIPVAQSNVLQQGRTRPIETILQRSQAGQYYGLILLAKSIPSHVKLHVFVEGAQIKPSTAMGSMSIPATAAEAVAVGAVDVRSGKLESFSSQGPTDDGRIKPELSAPDHTRSVTYRGIRDDHRFAGTSAAASHVAGYAALLKQMQPSASPPQLKKLLIRAVRSMADSVPNNQSGYGHIDASEVPLVNPVGTTRPHGASDFLNPIREALGL